MHIELSEQTTKLLNNVCTIVQKRTDEDIIKFEATYRYCRLQLFNSR